MNCMYVGVNNKRRGKKTRELGELGKGNAFTLQTVFPHSHTHLPTYITINLIILYRHYLIDSTPSRSHLPGSFTLYLGHESHFLKKKS